MHKVSIVVPVYGVENYIVHCAESLFCQTLDDMQFIFVDDASPDNSIALLEQTLERFPQRKSQSIIIRNPRNLGLPASRAAGLSHVDSSYVAHCDPDDYVETTMYAKLYEKAIQNDSDMVICGRTCHYADGRVKSFLDKPNPKDDLIFNYLFGCLSPYVWCRLTKTDIYRRVRFPENNYLEDYVQFAQLLTYAKRISFLNEFVYHYCQRPDSITSNRDQEAIQSKIRQGLSNFKLMHDFIVEHHRVKEKYFIIKKHKVRSLYYLLPKQCSFRKQYLQTFPEINFSILFNLRIPARDKLFHLLIISNLQFNYKFIKILKNIVRFLRTSKRVLTDLASQSVIFM